MERRLDGRVALVTGGGSGIGAATARRLAAEGARVLVTGRRAARLGEVVETIGAAGGQALAFAADLTGRDAADHAVAAAVGWAGRLDIAVNAAGSFPYTPFESMADGDWAAALELNLSAVMRVCRAAARAMGEAGGAIVNVSSTNAVMGDRLSACGAYSAAKAGQLGLTRQIAVELAPRVRVNAVVPGAVRTEMLAGWNEDPGDMAAWLERYTPMARIGQPEDIAGAVAFLVSDDAAYVTGVALPVDGGMCVV
jgi:meso-butanediol dehydrogenase/(S,S)-butanediol dehydrogenase/diacetyl reductase